MATRWIHAGLETPDAVGGKAGFAVNDKGQLSLRKGLIPSTTLLGTDPEEQPIPLPSKITVSGGDKTLLPGDNGALVIIDDTTSRTVTLPAATYKCKFSFYIAGGTTTHQIDPAGNDGAGGMSAQGALLTFVDGKYLQATAVTGSAITLQADGVADWYIMAAAGTWSKQG